MPISLHVFPVLIASKYLIQSLPSYNRHILWLAKPLQKTGAYRNKEGYFCISGITDNNAKSAGKRKS